MNNALNVIGQYAWYDNDVLDRSITLFQRTGNRHNEILESALGIAGLIAQGKIKDAEILGRQLRVVLLQMQYDASAQPPDEGQLTLMMMSGDYPIDVRERIAGALGFRSLQEFAKTTKSRIAGIERIR